MEQLDITSEYLKAKGYRLVKEGVTMAFYYNGSCKRTGFNKKDWDGSWRKLENKLESSGFPREIISEVDSCMAKNYGNLITDNDDNESGGNGAAQSSPSSSQQDNNNTIMTQETIQLTEELTKEVSCKEISEILSTSIKNDENPKLITFNGMLLAQTKDDQLNLGFQAESSVGKSYIPLDVATYFPESEIQKIASASPTAFYHSGEWDPDRKALIVDLRHKILIFLDMPHFQLLEKLRPMLSHDDAELHYKITDKSQKYGLRTKDVTIKGPPSVFFCSTKMDPDDQEKTRMIQLSPSTDEGKLKESLELLTLKKSDYEEYERRIKKDPQRVWLTKRIMCVRQWGIREVKIPDEGKAVFERFIREHNHLLPTST